MDPEEKKRLEDAARAAREAADQAHEAAAAAAGADDALNSAAETAEDAAQEAQTALDAAVPAPVESEVPATPVVEDTDIDFEKELEALAPGQAPAAQPDKRPELEKAEKALFFNAKRVKELGGDPGKVLAPVAAPPQPPAAPTPDAPETPAPAYVTEESLNKRDLAAEIRKLSRTEAEYKVTAWHAENSIKASGDPVKDAENAYLIAHKGRITRSFEEIRRAGFSRPAPGAPPGRRAPVVAKAPELQPAEKVVMQRRGFALQPDGSWESKRYHMRFDTAKKGWVTEKKP